jgi:1,4-alpha-glucan branching enzyme
MTKLLGIDMKFKLTILALIIFGFQYSFSQVVQTVPAYATENDSIVVKFNAKLGDGGLAGFTGTVYAYTGVITNNSTSSSNWKHVISSGWADYQHQPVLTKIGTDLYQLVIGYPRKYYSVTDTGEHILKLAFVFKNSDGTKTGRDVGAADIFAPLYSSGISIVLNSPTLPTQFSNPLSAPVFANPGDTVDISAKAVGSNIAEISLSINGTLKSRLSQDSIAYGFIANNYSSGTNNVLVVAVDSNGAADSLSFIIFNNPAVNQAQLPSGMEYGINYNSSNPTTATLVLFAPKKSFVYVLGDFNNWQVNKNYLMNEYQVTADSVIWWITLTNLSPGTEYAFQYLVDGSIRCADPFSEKILDPDNDSYISYSTYPDLKAYPAGKTQQIVSVLQTGQSEYNWQVTNFKKPLKTDLVVYELLVRDFVSTHDYNTLADTIGYFKRLGVNAIELLPIMEFEGNESWGYNPNFHFAPDKYYGTKNDLKHFIDVAHQNGIAVILDAPMNGIMGSSPLAKLYWDSANNRPAANNPWLNPFALHDYSVGCDFNHNSPETRYYMKRFTSHWISDYHVDGFRFDLAKGYTQTPYYTISNGSIVYNDDAMSQYDASRIYNLERIADNIRNVDSTAYTILELFSVVKEENELIKYGTMVWDNMNNNYGQASMGYSTGWDLSGTSYLSFGSSLPGYVAYMESHDEEREMYRNLTYGNSSGSYNIKDTVTALNRLKLCEALFYTIPGPKMLWQFGELGYDFPINYNGRVGDKPIRWDYYSNTERLKLYKTTATLINLKTKYPAFRSSNFTVGAAREVKFVTILDSTMDVLAFGNFDIVNQASDVTFPVAGTWYDYFSGDSISLTTDHQFTLRPGELHIYTTVKLPLPEQDLITGVEGNNEKALVKSFDLKQNYPNPFNPSTVIKYQIPKAGIVKLKVYDILGREVSMLVNGEKSAGEYTVSFDGSRLASGVYFYTIQSGSYISTKKMLLLK